MPISSGIQRYVAIKRGPGYKFADQEQMLQKYAAFAEWFEDKYISAAQIIEWAATAPSAQRSREWLWVARNFAISMHAEDDRHEIPPCDVFGKGKRPRPTPHIIAVMDIDRIMQAALWLPPIASLNPYTYHYLYLSLSDRAPGHDEAAHVRSGRAAPNRRDGRWTADP